MSSVQGYSWPGVLEFLYMEHQSLAVKENLWFLERKDLHDRLKETEAKLTAVEFINADLRSRNNMLEHCLRQMRYSINHQRARTTAEKNEKVASAGKGFCESEEKQDIRIPQRRPRPNRAHLAKILCSLGIGNLMEDLNKELQGKVPQANLKIDLPTVEPRMQNSNKGDSVPKSTGYKEITTLEEHGDGVRDICFLKDRQLLVSVSQDAQMKVWNLQGADRKEKGKVECVGTVREHNGPIFTVSEGQGLIFSGGMQGIIRCWSLPKKLREMQSKKLLVGSWSNSQQQKLEPIWQLIYSEEHKLLISTSSEMAIKAFRVEMEETKVTGKHRCSFVHHSHSDQEDIPTAVCISGQNTLLAGYVSSNKLVQFSLQTQQIVNELSFACDGQVSTNKIVSQGSSVIGAFEDCMIRIFEHGSLVHSFEAHEESVMSVCLASDKELVSCGQDGMVKVWDMRKFDSLAVFRAHRKKYDEAGHCVASNHNGMFASGGADAVVKLFSAV